MDTNKLINAKTNASNATKNEKSSMTNEKNVAENNSDRLLDVLHIDTDKRNNTTQVTRRGRPKKIYLETLQEKNQKIINRVDLEKIHLEGLNIHRI